MSRTPWKRVIAFAVAVVLVIVRSRVAERGSLSELPQRLKKLRGRAGDPRAGDPRAFVGFCTRDDDALYFVHENGVLYLDYELTTPATKSHADAFRQTATDLGCSVVESTYYGEFPLLRVDTGASEMSAAAVGAKVAQRMFGYDQNTMYEFLP